ncbi:MAG: aspartyl protease family protein [Acidimicrobiales bacterium]
MCVDGRGPFPFVLDTGATSTLFDTHFLDDVRFPQDAPVEVLHQPGCATVVLHVAVNRWSIGPVELAAQSAAVVRMPGFGLTGQPVGVLGSDVLSRFGALRIDYRAQLLTVAGPEGSTSVEGTSIDGPTAVPVAPGLVGVGARAAVPLDVTTSASGTSVLTPVTFGTRGPFPFAVATGDEASAVTALLAAKLGLAKTGRSEQVTSFGCIHNAPAVRSGPWAIGSVALPPMQMTTAVAASSSSDAEGLVGSDALSGYGSVVLDYRSGSLFLGAGASAG